MTCEEPNITIRFPDIGLEIRPLTMEFQRDEGLLDSLRAKFSRGVADELEPHTDKEGALNESQPVLLVFDGIPTFRMMFVPDGLRIGVHNAHIEFFDLQRSLTKGTVDMQRDSIKLKEAYKKVFAEVPTSPGGTVYYKGIKFSVPEEAYEELLAFKQESSLAGTKRSDRADKLIKEEYDRKIRENPDKESFPMPAVSAGPYIRSIEQRRVLNIIEGTNAIDFDQISPYEAIQRLNEKFGVTTWTGTDGYLWVGRPETSGYTHIACPDDSRVWKIIDHDIRPPTEPVKQAIMRGKWYDDPNEDVPERIGEGIPLLGEGSNDYRVEGVAYKDGTAYGKEVGPIEVEASRDMLPSLAEQKLKEEIKAQWDGTIEIQPSLSGTEYTDPRFVNTGDPIILVPPDKDKEHTNEKATCDWAIKEGVYLITGFRHRVTEQGSWKLELSVLPYPEVSLPDDAGVTNEIEAEFHRIKSYIRYWDPSEEEVVTGEAFESQQKAGKPDWLKG